MWGGGVKERDEKLNCYNISPDFLTFCGITLNTITSQINHTLLLITHFEIACGYILFIPDCPTSFVRRPASESDDC